MVSSKLGSWLKSNTAPATVIVFKHKSDTNLLTAHFGNENNANNTNRYKIALICDHKKR